MVMQAAPAMAPVYQTQKSPELIQAEEDYKSLKALKKERDSQTVFCPACEQRGPTKVTKQTSLLQWGACLVMHFTGIGDLGCQFIPLCCCSKCQDHVHRCGKCNVILGAARGSI